MDKQIVENQIIQPPWEGISHTHTFAKDTNIENSNEAIKLAKLDWKVEKRPVYMENFSGTATEIPNYSVIVRKDNDKSLGIVGNRYEPQQNINSFEFLDSLVAQGLMKYELAGSINGGKKIWLLGKIGQSEIVPNDLVNQYIMLMNSHDGSSRLNIFYTTVRAICWNMVNLAINNSIRDKFSIMHTKNIEAKLEEAQEVLAIGKKKFSSYKELCKMLTNISMTTEKLTDFTKNIFPVPKDVENHQKMESRRQSQRNKIVELFENGTGMDIPGVAGTGWAAYNAVTEYVNHFRPTRNSSNQRDNQFMHVASKTNPFIHRATEYLIKAA